ncbi:MAG TPA: SDR family NAD(P)-dependent oxidoreductase, partial [Planctomycetota bacterium]|nr:SDR family NAD(P)-dependent oxidoreductase [Planctomycetota bacterium]
GGAIINVGSVLSDRAIPLQGAYTASKHAVKGFTDSLRMELEEAGAPISVTLVKPAAINTPYTKHARSYLPTHPRNPAPLYDPQVVAKAILRCAVAPRRDVYVGGFGRMYALMEMFMPRATDRYMEKTMFAKQQGDAPNEATDHLEAPTTAEGEERGDHAGMVLKHSAYTAAALHPVAALAMGVGVVGIIASVMCGRRAPAPEQRRRAPSTWTAIEDQEHANAGVSPEARDLEASARADRLGINAEVETSPYEYVP